MDQKKRDRYFRRLASRRSAQVVGGAPDEKSLLAFFLLAQHLLMVAARTCSPSPTDGQFKVIAFGNAAIGLPTGILLADDALPGRCVVCLCGDDGWVFSAARYSGSFADLVGNMTLMGELAAQEPQTYSMVELALKDMYALES